MTNGKKKINRFMGWGKIVLLALLITMGIRFFLLESFHISSAAMETAVLNGDYLLVNKAPFIHAPKRNAILLFASPLLKDSLTNTLFLSRCIGMPGDTVELLNNTLRINGKEMPKSPNSLSQYEITDGIGKTVFRQMKRLTIPIREVTEIGNTTRISLTPFEEYQLREELPDVLNERFTSMKSENYKLIVPKKGIAYRLDPLALVACKEIILSETDQKAVFRDNKLYLDGRETSYFFFRENYYWMLSDHTTDGIDSRHLGFIPDNCLIGSALLIWLSKQPDTGWGEGYRWKRLFNIVN